MVNEQIPASVQGVDQQAIGGSNPLNLVNGEAAKEDNAVGSVSHKSFIDQIASFIAKLSGNPDPFTGKENITVTPKPEFQAVTQTKTSEIKPENQTNTAQLQSTLIQIATVPVVEEGGLFGKFSEGLAKVLDNVGGKVEVLGEKALGSAANVVNKGLEQAEKVGENAIEKAQETAKNTVNDITASTSDQPINTQAEVSPGPDYFFGKATTTDSKQ